MSKIDRKIVEDVLDHILFICDDTLNVTDDMKKDPLVNVRLAEAMWHEDLVRRIKNFTSIRLKEIRAEREHEDDFDDYKDLKVV